MRKPRPFAHRPIYYEERLGGKASASGEADIEAAHRPVAFSQRAKRKGIAAVSLPMLLSVLLILAAVALLVICSKAA